MHNFVFFRCGKKYYRIDLDAVRYIQAEKRCTSFITDEKCFPVCVGIGDIEKILPSNLFCRVHRSFIVSLKYTDEFDNELAIVGKKKIPISEQYKNSLKISTTIINNRKLTNVD